MPFSRSKTRKLKAFTLSEIMVVLLLTTIVVGLAFTILQLVQTQMSAIGKNYGNNTEVNRLRQALWIDFSTYARLSFDAANQVLSCQNETGSIDYFFVEGLILRDRDTFDLKLSKMALYFDGSEHASGPIDALELTTTKDQGTQTIFVHQPNAANEYMY